MKPGTWWPAAVAAVLGLTVAANGFLLYEASDHEAAVVEPDYYAKAVRWDSTLAERRHDRDLGWRIEADLIATGGANTALSVRVLDREGAPIRGATGTVIATHNLDAARPVSARLVARSAADYAASLPLRRAGLWELRFEIARGSDRFGATLHRDLTPVLAGR